MKNVIENLSFEEDFRFKNLPDESTPLDEENLNIFLENEKILKQNFEKFQKDTDDKLSILTEMFNGNNAGFHNSIFRGKDITSYLDDDTLWTRISSGTFDDLFIGDYFKKDDIKYRIAGFDYYLHKGQYAFEKHHAVIVPDSCLAVDTAMNDTADTSTGYINCKLVKNELSPILNNLKKIFGDNHILQHWNLLTTASTKTLYNRYGKASGASSGFGWYNREIDLMSEYMVFGSIVWSSSGFDAGCTTNQLPLFKIAPEFICIRKSYWLRDIASGDSFSRVHEQGLASGGGANDVAGGVRPYFFIG